jgi:hypothetical protein
MDEQSFLALKRECEKMLKAYVVQAKKTCALLGRSKGKSMSRKELENLMRHRFHENELHHQYMQIRERLFEVAHLGSRAASSTQL